MALDAVENAEEDRLAFRTGTMSTLEAFERGIVDELGYEIPARSSRPTGLGPCPRCAGKTSLRNGPFGEFYGCEAFPECKGSRSK
jgi:ssDNA-binding Zn-finger/Zn-ribbon topoisomerase 1